MKVILFALILLLMSILSASCTKELKYTKEELYAKAQAADPGAQLILPRSINEGVNCADYSEGCLSAHTVKIKGLNIIAVEFSSQDESIYAAKKFRGYYSRNWLLDDVRGEPILEKFVTENLDAKLPPN